MKKINYNKVFNFLVEMRNEYDKDSHSYEAINYLIERFLHEF